jgi:2-C-methyl-D-erythritol 4-phosphate cytidylyltransferase
MASEGTQTAVAVVAAAGTGQRMGGRVPKQLLEIRNKPILLLTLEQLERVPEIESVVLAVGSGILDAVRERLPKWGLDKVLRVVAGGLQRQDTVARALQQVPETADLVVVHDGVRPFVSVGKVSEVIRAAGVHGAAILALRPRNTLKLGNGEWILETVERGRFWDVQTPQAFRRDLLARAYAKAAADGFHATDDAHLVERIGHPVFVVEGEERNIKITAPLDLMIAERFLEEAP